MEGCYELSHNMPITTCEIYKMKQYQLSLKNFNIYLKI